MYLIAKEIGDDALKYYTEDYYLKDSEFIYNAILEMRAHFKESRLAQNNF